MPAAMEQSLEAKEIEEEPLKPLRLEWADLTVKGSLRPINQDQVYTPSGPQLKNERGFLFLVADGFNPGGEVASHLAVDTIAEEYYADTEEDISASLIHAIEAANRIIYQKANEKRTLTGMGTTVVAAVVRGHELYVANVGDSRAYLIHDDKIEQITLDHNALAEALREGGLTLTLEQIGRHPDRSLLTRALGLRSQVEVDIFQRRLRQGDITVLCSDGLANLGEYVRDSEIKEVVKRHPPASAVKRLVKLAKDKGGRDDISVILIRAV